MAVNIKGLSNTVPIKDFEHTLEPLWADDTGRNANSGKFTGTFIGYFSNLNISFGSCTQAQFNTVKSAFEHPTMEVLYPANNGTNKTEYFYGTAINGTRDRWTGRYKPFKIKLVARDKW